MTIPTQPPRRTRIPRRAYAEACRLHGECSWYWNGLSPDVRERVLRAVEKAVDKVLWDYKKGVGA